MMRPPVILAYHVIADVSREHDPDLLAVAPELFERQLARLARRGYSFVTVRELAARLGEAGRRPPAGICAVTFDDGSEDNATVVPDLLRSLGVPATMYVCPGMFGRPHPFLNPASGVRIMTEDQMRELAASPEIEIGSHTTDHTELATAGEDEALRLLRESKLTLERLLGAPVHSFAYPRCRYSAGAVRAAREAGFTSAVTCGPRGSWHPYELRREYVVHGDGGLTFELKTRGIFRLVRTSAPGRALAHATRRMRPS
jgi:peptidoglycan/xylan/chitin deacetylase (PgdA/CDA1 family)